MSPPDPWNKPVPKSWLLALGALAVSGLVAAAAFLCTMDGGVLLCYVPLGLEIAVIIALKRALTEGAPGPAGPAWVVPAGMLGVLLLGWAVFRFWPGPFCAVALGLEFPLIGFLDHVEVRRSRRADDLDKKPGLLEWYWGAPLGVLFSAATTLLDFFYAPLVGRANTGYGVAPWGLGLVTIVYVVSRAARKPLPLLRLSTAGYFVFVASAVAAWFGLMLVLHPC